MRKLSFLKATLPSPMSNRQLIVGASGCYLDNAVLIRMSSVKFDEGPWFKDFSIPKTFGKSKDVTMNVPQSFVHIKPLSPTKTEVKMLFSGDPKMDYVPQSLINFTIK